MSHTHSNPPKIGYLTSIYPRASDTFIRGEIHALRRLGHDVSTFAIHRPTADQLVSEEIREELASTCYVLPDGAIAQAIAAVGGVVRLAFNPHTPQAVRLAWRCRWAGIRGHIWALAYLAEAALLDAMLRKQRIEHLHDHIGENSAAIAMIAATLAGIPYSLTIHGPYEFDEPARLAVREKIAHSKFVAAISEFTRAQLCRWARPESWKKIHIVHCAVHPEFLSAQASELPDAPMLVCVGRLCPEKGQLVLLEALAMLRRANKWIPVVLVGDGPMRSEIEAAIIRLGLTDQAVITDWKSASEVRRYIRQAWALVLPSFAEGLPVVIMEALALERPVISTYVAGIPELVIPGQNGWLVPAGSAAKLAAAIAELLDTPRERLMTMGKAGAARIRAEHDPDQEAAKLASLIMSNEEAKPAGVINSVLVGQEKLRCQERLASNS